MNNDFPLFNDLKKGILWQPSVDFTISTPLKSAGRKLCVDSTVKNLPKLRGQRCLVLDQNYNLNGVYSVCSLKKYLIKKHLDNREGNAVYCKDSGNGYLCVEKTCSLGIKSLTWVHFIIPKY